MCDITACDREEVPPQNVATTHLPRRNLTCTSVASRVMSSLLRGRQRTDDSVSSANTGTDTRTSREPRSRSRSHSPLFRVGRALFGGVLALNAVDNLRNLEERVAYAEAKDAPAPEQSVPLISSGLLFGGLGVALWQRPATAAAVIAGFLASVTPVMHDFWNYEDDEQKQQELVHFLKNTALLGAAIAFMKEAQRREP